MSGIRHERSLPGRYDRGYQSGAENGRGPDDASAGWWRKSGPGGRQARE